MCDLPDLSTKTLPPSGASLRARRIVSSLHDALLAHATQVDPESAFWFGLPRDAARSVHPWDDYVLAQSRVDSEPPEDDLFAGVV